MVGTVKIKTYSFNFPAKCSIASSPTFNPNSFLTKQQRTRHSTHPRQTAFLSMESKKEKLQEVPRELPAMFRPPVNRAMKTLDRSFFRKTVPLAAAKIFEKSQISSVRQALGKNHDLLALPRLNVIREFKEQDGAIRKGLLLREDIKVDGRWQSSFCDRHRPQLTMEI